MATTSRLTVGVFALVGQADLAWTPNVIAGASLPFRPVAGLARGRELHKVGARPGPLHCVTGDTGCVIAMPISQLTQLGSFRFAKL